MQKQTSLILALLTIVLSAIPVHVSKADTRIRTADITRALQTEYQKQLKKSSNARQTSAKRNILADYQRFLHQSKPSSNRKKTTPRPALASSVVPRAVPRPKPKPRAIVEKPPIPEPEELFEAATRGDYNTIARLLRDGININVGNQQKETALHMAAARGHYSTVIFLINNGANPFSRTVKQWLAIHHATRFRHANIVNYLMKKGLSPRFRTSDGYSSIDMARTNNDRRLLNLFGAK